MKPFKKNLLLEQILNKPKLNLDVEAEDYLTPFEHHMVTVFVIFINGIVNKHEHIIQSCMNVDTQEYMFFTKDDCYIYRRELVRQVIERKE